MADSLPALEENTDKAGMQTYIASLQTLLHHVQHKNTAPNRALQCSMLLLNTSRATSNKQQATAGPGHGVSDPSKAQPFPIAMMPTSIAGARKLYYPP